MLNPKVNFYFNQNSRWAKEIQQLRTIVLSCNLEEVLKWGCPCYVSGGRNIVLIHVFKNYCALLFFKGRLLKDENDLLIQQTPNVQTPRQLRFTCLEDIFSIEPIIKSYILEAAWLETSNLMEIVETKQELNLSQELLDKFNQFPGLQKAFESLTPGRQRAYHLFFIAPKLLKTRIARIEKCIPAILSGKGLIINRYQLYEIENFVKF